MRTAKTTAIAITATAALLGTAGAAAAVAGSGDDSGSGQSATAAVAAKTAAGKDGQKQQAHHRHAPTKDGARRLCRRAPKINKRINRVLHRLDGKAGRRGSTARLEKRIENANKAGHDAIATYLNHRLADRRALAPKLKERQKDLAKVRTWCSANNNGRSKS